jgi:hypothetical protein
VEVDSEDVEELVEDQNAELTTEDLWDLHMEQQQEVAEELLSEEEEVDSKGSIPIPDFKELLGYWSTTKTQKLVEKWHPNIAVVNMSINLFTDNVMQYFIQLKNNGQNK